MTYSLIALLVFIHAITFLYINKLGIFLDINGDSDKWVKLSQLVITGKDFSREIWWPPLYFLFIAPFNLLPPTLTYIGIFQTVIFLITLFILYGLTKSFINNPKISFLLVLLYGLIPSHIILTKLPLSETLFIFLYTFHLFFMYRFFCQRKTLLIFLSMIFLILATFTKPFTLFLSLPELLIIYLILKPKGKELIKLGIVTLLIPFLIYLSWSYKNYTLTNIFTFSNVSNYNLLAHNFYHIYNYTDTYKQSPNYPKPQPFSEFYGQSGENLNIFLKTQFLNDYLMKDLSIDPSSLSENERYGYAGKLGQDLIIKNIFIYIPIHVIESLGIFKPNMLQTASPIFKDFKLILIMFDLVIGIIYFTLFSIGLKKLCPFKKNKHNNPVYVFYLLLLINLIYLMLIVGPTTFDDGGRSSFVFYLVLTLFISIIFLPNKKTH